MAVAATHIVLLTVLAGAVIAAERSENFDKDPGWHAHNNRAASPEPRTIRQDFGHSSTSHFGGALGEAGGFINPAAEPAYYAKEIREQTFNDPLSASGTLVCPGREFHVLVGFFNAGTVNEWRTPNTIALRLQGRGDVFYAYVEYTTSRWRAGGDSPGGFSQVPEPNGRFRLRGFPTGSAVHRWSLRYDPNGHGGHGSITVTMDDETAICHLDPGHKANGATFNRFGLLTVMKQYDTGGELWLDELSINGEKESFDRDPGWKAVGIDGLILPPSCARASTSVIARRRVMQAERSPGKWAASFFAAMAVTRSGWRFKAIVSRSSLSRGRSRLSGK